MPGPAEFPFWSDEKFRVSDTDLNGHINNTAIGQMYEAGRSEILMSVMGVPADRPITTA